MSKPIRPRHLANLFRIPSILRREWEAIDQLLASGDTEMTLDEAVAITGMPTIRMFAVMALMTESELCELDFLVKHGCSDAPVARRAFMDGFQPTPWDCPNCKQTVRRPDDLGYEVLCRLSGPVRVDFAGYEDRAAMLANPSRLAEINREKWQRIELALHSKGVGAKVSDLARDASLTAEEAEAVLKLMLDDSLCTFEHQGCPTCGSHDYGEPVYRFERPVRVEMEDSGQ